MAYSIEIFNIAVFTKKWSLMLHIICFVTIVSGQTIRSNTNIALFLMQNKLLTLQQYLVKKAYIKYKSVV